MKMANHPRPGDIIQESLENLMSACASLPEQWKLRPQRQPIADRKSSFDARNGNKTFRVIGSSPQMWLNLQNAWSLAERKKRWMCRDCAVWLRNKKMDLIKRHLKLMTNATLPDALRYQAYTFTAIYWI